MEADRRISNRQRTTVAVEIDGRDRRGRVGVTRDASPTGMLMATPSRFEVGEPLDLTLFLGHRLEKVTGRVTRVETTSAKSNETWRYRLAVAFDAPLAVPVTLLPS